MNIHPIREFRLSPPGSGRGVSCDTNGAFIGSVPLLKRSNIHGKDRWEPHNCQQLSKQLSSELGLPIDLSSKMGGLKAISNALNEGEVARAQVAAVLLAIPEPPPLRKSAPFPSEMIKFIRDLHWSGLMKADWDPVEHPRWPAGTPDRQGGQFAPKGTAAGAPSSSGDDIASHHGSDDDLEHRTREKALNDGVYHPGSDLVELNPTASMQIAAEWPSNGPPDEAAICARFARLCVLLAPLFLSGDTPQHV